MENPVLVSLILTFLLITTLYFATLIWLKQGYKHLNQPQKKLAAVQNVSVIVACRNEEKNLPDLLSALKAQHIPPNLSVEYILVNDRSSDRTAEIIEAQAQQNNQFQTVHITERIAGFGPKKRAIDLAIKQAKGEVLLFTDADGRPGTQWISKMVSFFDNGADMVLGYAPYILEKKESLYKKLLALEYFSHAMVASATAAINFPLTCVGTNMAYRKNVYEQIGGFGKYKPFISGDDDLFLTLVREAGNYNIHYAHCPETHVYNAPPNTFRQFVNQRLRYASKGLKYPLRVTLILAIYLLFNVGLTALFIAGIFLEPIYLWGASTIMIVKSILEFALVKKAAQVIGERRVTQYYFLLAPFHIIYIIFFGIAGQFNFFKWSEGKMESGIQN